MKSINNYAKSYIISLTVQQSRICVFALTLTIQVITYIFLLLLRIKQCHRCYFFSTWNSSVILWTKNISIWWRFMMATESMTRLVSHSFYWWVIGVQTNKMLWPFLLPDANILYLSTSNENGTIFFIFLLEIFKWPIQSNLCNLRIKYELNYRKYWHYLVN